MIQIHRSEDEYVFENREFFQIRTGLFVDKIT